VHARRRFFLKPVLAVCLVVFLSACTAGTTVSPTATQTQTEDPSDTATPQPAASPAELQRLLAQITPEDITDIWYNDAIQTQTAALLLNQAAARLIEHETLSLDITKSLWWLTIELGGEQASQYKDNSISLNAGLEENVVSITFATCTLYTDNAALYTLMRTANDYKMPIDEQALDRFLPYIKPRIDSLIDRLNAFSPGNCTGADMIGFYQRARYDDLTDGTVYVYNVQYGFILNDLSKAPWAGGPYVDSTLRFRGYDNYSYFIALERDGEITFTTFLGYDIYIAETEEGQEDAGRYCISQAIEQKFVPD